MTFCATPIDKPEYLLENYLAGNNLLLHIRHRHLLTESQQTTELFDSILLYSSARASPSKQPSTVVTKIAISTGRTSLNIGSRLYSEYAEIPLLEKGITNEWHR